MGDDCLILEDEPLDAVSAGFELARVGFDADIVKPFVKENRPQVEVSGVQFTVLSTEEICQFASVEVLNRDLYMHQAAGPNGQTTQNPVQNGVLDKRFGCRKSDGACVTCGLDYIRCCGHWGVLRLPNPVFHIGYFKWLIRILYCICKTCGYLLIDEDWREGVKAQMRRATIDYDALVRMRLFNRLVEHGKKKTHCINVNCGAIQGKIVKQQKADLSQFLKLFHKYTVKDDTGRSVQKLDELTPSYIYALLKKVTVDDCEVLNITNPEKLLITGLPVPPTSIRPSINLPGQPGTNEDDITCCLSEIADLNQVINRQRTMGTVSTQIAANHELLQLQTARLINTEAPGVAQIIQTKGGSKVGRGITQRLKGKEGRFRGNLSGKRVDFSGRTVISPDPNAEVNQVVVPEWQAKRLTFPEYVTYLNIEKLRKAVLAGADKWPGAAYVHKIDGTKSSLRFANRRQVADALKPGDIVERHLWDGDIVLFNRQPSLHRMSIMALRAKVRPWRTLRFNECVCAPFNADFDGDEMNIHLPQTQEARAEAYHLMGVQNNLVTPKNGEPLVSATQDFLSGTYLLCNKDVFMSRDQFWQVCCNFTDGLTHVEIPPPAILKPKELWTGKQVISVMLRPNSSSSLMLNFELKERDFDKNVGHYHPLMCRRDGYVLMRRSELMCGAIGKKTIGGSKDGMIFNLIRDNSNMAACIVMMRLAQCCARWFSIRGMTIGIDDVTPGPIIEQAVQDVINEGYRKCEEIHKSFLEGRLQPDPGCTTEQTWEAKTKAVLDDLRGAAGDAVNARLPHYNKPLIMLQSGAKGAVINIAQMVACVGQQNVGGKRPWNGFVGRTLPHYTLDEVSARSKGFVANSFYSGLQPDEFWFHTMSGREGLVDTAVKTAETGYMQRRLIKSLEDLSVVYDTSVRTSDGQIVQFIYGDDGMNPQLMEDTGKSFNFNKVMSHVSSYVTKLYIDEYDALLPPNKVKAKAKAKSKLRKKIDLRRKKVTVVEEAPKSLVDVDFNEDNDIDDSSISDEDELLVQNSIFPPDDLLTELQKANYFSNLKINLETRPDGTVLDYLVWNQKEKATVIQQKFICLKKYFADNFGTNGLKDVPVSTIRGLIKEGKNKMIVYYLYNILVAIYINDVMNKKQRGTPLLPYEMIEWGIKLALLTQEFIPEPIRQHELLNMNEAEREENKKGSVKFFYRADVSTNDTDELIQMEGNGSGDLLKFIFDKAKQCAEARQDNGMIPALQRSSYLKALKKMDGHRYDVSVFVATKSIDVTISVIYEFLQVCWRKFVRAFIPPGEACGAIGAQSIGEPGTQMTLKTFHFAGVASMNVTLGVPRIKEIINAALTISTPVVKVPLTIKDSFTFAQWVKGRLEATKLIDIATYFEEVYTSSGVELDIKLDHEMICNLGIDVTSQTVVDAISVSETKFWGKTKFKDCAASVIDTYRLSVRVPAMDKELLFQLQALGKEIGDLHVTGLQTVKRAIIKEDKNKSTGLSEFSLLLEGTDVLDIMALEGVDYKSLRYNHVMEVNDVLGIEAARRVIIEEIKGCMDAYGMEIDLRHMMLLGEVMTFRGEVLGISRFGIQKMRASTLMLASFEETNEHLFQACVTEKYDRVDGVSECILLGKNVSVGTGAFQVMLQKPEIKTKTKMSVMERIFNKKKPSKKLEKITYGRS